MIEAILYHFTLRIEQGPMELFHSAKDDLVEAYDAIMGLQGLVELQQARNKVSVKLIIFMYNFIYQVYPDAM